MTFKLYPQLLAASLMIGILQTGSAEALPIAMPQNLKAADSAVVQVQYHPQGGMHNGMNWQPQMHGNRCRTRSGNCQHYHQGYYYQTPWWTLPLIVSGAMASGGSHAAWCRSHYRSYNPRSDMWVDVHGRHYRCSGRY